MEEKVIQDKIYRITDRRQEGLNYYISFIFWPFAILLAALRHWDRPWAKNVFWIFCIFFGYTFIIAKDGSDDAARHAIVFVNYAHSDLNLEELWRSFYSEGSKYVDIASPLIMYLVSRITDNPSVLYAVFGLIFGYFYSRNLWFVLDRIKGKITGIVFLYLLVLALFIPVWVIGNFRMWAAAHIFVFGVFPYILEGNSRRLIWSFLSVFVHFSFLFPIGILILYILMKNRLDAYFVFFIITAFVKEIDLEAFASFLSFLPDVFDSKIAGYSNSVTAEILENNEQSYNWYIPLASDVINWVVYTIVIYIYFFCRLELKKFPELFILFSFSLFFYGCSNIFSLVPSGGRFITVSNIFLFAFFIIFMTTLPDIKGLKVVRTLTIPALLLFCIVRLRIGMDYYGLMTILGNPVLSLFNLDNFPLIKGVKQLLF